MTLLLVQAISTWAMTALIWFVQLVQYPSFSLVAEQSFPSFHAHHSNRITFLVAPLMIAEAVTALALVWRPMPDMHPWELWTGLGLVGVIWASTFLFQVPMHHRLGRAFDPSAWRFLVASNWVRTVCWSFRAALVTAWVHRLLEPAIELFGGS